jgi:hypothetical protein
MRIPAARERVRIEGRPEIFLVVWVDTDRRVADLISTVEGGVEESVPFARILPLHGNPLQIEGTGGII